MVETGTGTEIERRTSRRMKGAANSAGAAVEAAAGSGGDESRAGRGHVIGVLVAAASVTGVGDKALVECLAAANVTGVADGALVIVWQLCLL